MQTFASFRAPRAPGATLARLRLRADADPLQTQLRVVCIATARSSPPRRGARAVAPQPLTGGRTTAQLSRQRLCSRCVPLFIGRVWRARQLQRWERARESTFRGLHAAPGAGFQAGPAPESRPCAQPRTGLRPLGRSPESSGAPRFGAPVLGRRAGLQPQPQPPRRTPRVCGAASRYIHRCNKRRSCSACTCGDAAPRRSPCGTRCCCTRPRRAPSPARPRADQKYPSKPSRGRAVRGECLECASK